MSKLDLSGGLYSDKDNISASSASESASTNASKFKFKKGRKNSHRSTVTYRLNVETIDRIEELAVAARKSINETVQELLDLALDNIEVE